MAMKKGFSSEVVGSNIKDMLRAGSPKNQAIAASLMSARKYKKMAKGGMVGSEEEFDDNSDPMVPHEGHEHERMMPDETSMAMMDEKGPEDYTRSIYDEDEEADYHPDEVANPNEQMESAMLAKAIREKAMGRPENYAMGGLVQPPKDPDMGNKPSEDMGDETEEPMGSMPMKPSAVGYSPMDKQPSGMGLSEQAMEALKRKKMGRRYPSVTK